MRQLGKLGYCVPLKKTEISENIKHFDGLKSITLKGQKGGITQKEQCECGKYPILAMLNFTIYEYHKCV